MKHLLRIFVLIALFSPCVMAQNQHPAPYFVVRSLDSTQTAQMPLSRVEVDARIVGVIADVRLRQIYQNKGKQTLDATYIFPASTKAAVYAMQMQVGKRRIRAQIKEREQARAIFDSARAAGKTASLLEQQNPNVLSMNVANILPDDSIVVELRYTELISPKGGEYEFVVPTVVAPRYKSVYDTPIASTGNLPTTPDRENYQPAGAKPTYEYAFRMRIEAGVPLDRVYSPSHDISTVPDGDEMDVLIKDTEAGNRDIVVRYALRGEQIKQGMIAYEQDGEKFFLYMAQPPKPAVKPEIAPREYIFVVDVSGSMNGFPLRVSQKLMNDMLDGLRPTDKFNVLFFAGGNYTLADMSLPATAWNIEKAKNVLMSQQGGGTELMPALRRALDIPREKGYARSFVICTDGFINVERNAFDAIRDRLGDANFFSFGIGTGVNRYLIEGIAYAGNGEPTVVLGESEASDAAKKFKQYIENPLLTDITLDFGEMQVYDQEPKRIPDLFGEKPIIAFGKYKGTLKGEITLQGRQGNQAFSQKTDLQKVRPKHKNSALRYLWARERLKLLSDFGGMRETAGDKQKIIDLGLAYNLLTAHTSFVAVYEKVRESNPEENKDVQQTLPLPEGVPNSAQNGGKRGSYSASYVVVRGATFTEDFDYNSMSGVLADVVLTSYTGMERRNRTTICGATTTVKQSPLNNPEIFSMVLGDDIYKMPVRVRDGYVLQGALASGDGFLWHRAGLANSPSAALHDLNATAGYNNPANTGDLTFWRTPYQASKGHISFSTSQYLESALGVQKTFTVHPSLKFHTYTAGFWNPLRADVNNDGFADTKQGFGLRLAQKWSYAKNGNSLDFAYQYSKTDLQHGRLGEELSFPLTHMSDNIGISLQGSRSIYEGNINFAASWHQYQLNKGFSARKYTGKEQTMNLEMGIAKDWTLHKFAGKVQFRTGDTSESLDSLPLTRHETVLGGFAQYTLDRWEIFDGFRLTLSPTLRYDYHNLAGNLFSPAFAARIDWEDFRLSLGASKKIRYANVFMENNRYWASMREVSLRDAPAPERSFDYSASLDWTWASSNVHISPSVGWHVIQFENQLIVDAFSSPTRVQVSNLQGKAFLHRLIATLDFEVSSFDFLLRYHLQNQQATYNGETRQMPFVPRHVLLAGASYAFSLPKNGKFTPVLACNYIGRQEGIEAADLPTDYATWDFTLRYNTQKWRIDLKGENLLDFRLKQAVLYDASNLWATTLGRRVSLTLGYNF